MKEKRIQLNFNHVMKLFLFMNSIFLSINIYVELIKVLDKQCRKIKMNKALF